MDLGWIFFNEESLGGAIPGRCTFRFVSLLPRQIKSPWRQGLSHPGRRLFACVALSSLSCSRACTAGLFSPTFTCRTTQLFSLALVQLLPLVFYCRIASLACCIASLKYLALFLSVDLMLRTTLVVLPALGFLFCVCPVSPPCPLL